MVKTTDVFVSKCDIPILAPRIVDLDGDAEQGLLDVLLYQGVKGGLLRLRVLENVVAELQLEAADAVGTDDGSSPALGLGVILVQLGVGIGGCLAGATKQKGDKK